MNTHGLNIGLLTADLNSGNMGCNALGYSAILLIDDASRSLGFTPTYTIFGDIPRESIAWYGNLEETRIRIVSPALTLKGKVKQILRKKPLSIKEFYRAFDSCDLFFEIAGGDSFSDLYGIDRPRLFGRYHAHAARKRKPLVFLPQTIGPFESDEARRIASRSLSYASRIFARDPISLKKAIEFTAPERVTQSVDMACFMEYTPQARNTMKPRIGVNPSGLLWGGGYTGNNQFGLEAEYRSLICRIIQQLDAEGCEVVLVPHVLHGPYYHVEDDYGVCKRLQQAYPFCIMAPFFYTPVEAKSFISGLDLLVGSRMHCCIAAYSSGVPIYPLAYSRKFKGLFKDELKYSYGADLRSDDTESILEGLEKILVDLSHVQAEMPGRIEILTLYRQALVDELKTTISSVVK